MNRAQRRASLKAQNHKPGICRPARVPTLVALEVSPEVGISEGMALEAFRAGWAEKPQFNILAECCDMLFMGAEIKQDQQANQIAELGAMALNNVRDRFNEKQRIGATGDELAALRALVDFATDWWKRQSGEVFRKAYVAIDLERAQAHGVAA